MFKLLSSNRKKKELKLIKSCVYDCNTFHFLTFYSEKCKFNTALFLRFSQEYNYSFTSKFISVTCINLLTLCMIQRTESQEHREESLISFTT